MKLIHTLLLTLIGITGITAQRTHSGNIRIYFVALPGKTPGKAYQMPEDAFHFVGRNQKYVYHDKNLYYRPDSTTYRPTQTEMLDDYQHPEPLTDKYLAIDTIFMVMQKNFPTFVDRAYTHRQDAIDFAQPRGQIFHPVPYYHRTKDSYRQIARIKAKRLGIKRK